MEAMEKLKSGLRFSEVASQYSEDKARQGVGVPQGRRGEGRGAGPGRRQWPSGEPGLLVAVSVCLMDTAAGNAFKKPVCIASGTAPAVFPVGWADWSGAALTTKQRHKCMLILQL